MNTSTQNKPRVLGIVGATASAKTALSLPLAQALNCEIVCMDSMQIYRRMDIGTAKPTADERALIPHHMLDIVEPTEPFSVAQYVEQARTVIADIVHRGRVPMLVGGTGLYLQGLTLPMDYGGLPSDPVIRKRLTEQAEREGAASMHAYTPLIGREPSCMRASISAWIKCLQTALCRRCSPFLTVV